MGFILAFGIAYRAVVFDGFRRNIFGFCMMALIQVSLLLPCCMFHGMFHVFASVLPELGVFAS